MVYEQVVRYCKKEGITIHEFEVRCEMSNGAVGKWKKHTPSISSISKVIKYTGIPIGYWINDCL